MEIGEYLSRTRAGEDLCGVDALPCGRPAVARLITPIRWPDGRADTTSMLLCEAHAAPIRGHEGTRTLETLPHVADQDFVRRAYDSGDKDLLRSLTFEMAELRLAEQGWFWNADDRTFLRVTESARGAR